MSDIEETENEVKVTHTSARMTATMAPSPQPQYQEPPPSQYTRNITREPPKQTRPNETRTFTFAAGREQLGAIAILLGIIGAFFSVVTFTLDHAAVVRRLHQPIFSEWNLIAAVIIVCALVVAYLHPQHKWIYYSIACCSVVFVLLTLGNFILHMCLIDQTDSRYLTTPELKSIKQIVQAGAAFTFLDGVLKVLVTVICVVIIVLKV